MKDVQQLLRLLTVTENAYVVEKENDYQKLATKARGERSKADNTKILQ